MCVVEKRRKVVYACMFICAHMCVLGCRNCACVCVSGHEVGKYEHGEGQGVSERGLCSHEWQIFCS